MNSDSKNERTLLPFVVLIGVVVAPLIFIAGLIFGTELNTAIVLTSDSLFQEELICLYAEIKIQI